MSAKNKAGSKFNQFSVDLMHVKNILTKCVLAKTFVSFNGVRVVVLIKSTMFGQVTFRSVCLHRVNKNFSEI